MVNIDSLGKAPHYFQPYQITFGWVNKIKDRWCVVNSPYTCKDYMTDCMRTHNFMGALKFDPEGREYEAVSVNHTKLTFIIHIPAEHNIDDALACINKYERYLGFKQSVAEVATINHDGYKGNWYMVTGSGRWMTNTVMTSLYFTLFRLGMVLKHHNWRTLVKEVQKSCTGNEWFGNNDVMACKNYPKEFLQVLKGIKVINYTAQSNELAFKYTGYKTSRFIGHSTVGILFFLTALRRPHAEYLRDNEYYQKLKSLCV